MSDASAQRVRIYVFRILIVDRASKSGARSQEPVPSTLAHSLKGKTRPLSQEPTRNCSYILVCGQLGIVLFPGQTAKLEPRARSEIQKPRASASAVFRQIPHLRKAPGHQDNAQPTSLQARRDHRPTGVKPDWATTAIQHRPRTHLQG